MFECPVCGWKTSDADKFSRAYRPPISGHGKHWPGEVHPLLAWGGPLGPARILRAMMNEYQ